MTTTNSQTIVPSNTTNSVTTDFVFGTTKNDDNIGVVILKAASDGLGNPLDKSDVNVLDLVCHGTPDRPTYTAGKASKSESDLDPFTYFRKGNGTRPQYYGGIKPSKGQSSTSSSTSRNDPSAKDPARLASNLMKRGAVKSTRSSESSRGRDKAK